ncbi:hypothetical protein EC957_002179 [Mortierella hygrophila]|uniref:Pyridoxamine 5'-phosphate oxidase N-terminal domain-containing protein n=1 Tax=Mortierella hygrophila TaxID=979708 RepID=A0A9P6K1D8_9FUNG|nr:hypothetical protein EC957_002179 [Mortierella hygrophila]
MGKFFDDISENHAEWIRKQKLVFVSTAPLDPNGKVNLSPKGYDCFRVIGPNQVCYLEMTGSGIETQSHLQENGRVTIMFCAFEGGPKILRLFGHGTVLRIGTPEYNRLFATQYTPENCDIYSSKGIRSIILIDVYKVGISCGWGVPFFDYKGPRETLSRMSAKMTDEQFAGFWVKGNATSLDGLPGMRQERMGEKWAVLSGEDLRTLERFKKLGGGSGGVRWWDMKYLTENMAIMAVGAGVGTVVGAAAAVLFMNKRG